MTNVENLNALAKQAEANINNAYDRIERLREGLNFQDFEDGEPEILVTNDPYGYYISLWWGDMISDIESVIQAYKKHGKITPQILTELNANL